MRFALVVSIVVVLAREVVMTLVVALPRTFPLPRDLPRALPNVENVVSAPVIASAHTSSMLHFVLKQLDSKARSLMLELLFEVGDDAQEVVDEEKVDKLETEEESGDDLEDSEFKLGCKLDEEPGEFELAIEFEGEELEEKDSNNELEDKEDDELDVRGVKEDLEEDNVELLLNDVEVLVDVEEPAPVEELLHTSTTEHNSTNLQFLRNFVVVAVVLPIISVVSIAVVVAVLPRVNVVPPSVVAAVVSS